MGSGVKNVQRSVHVAINIIFIVFQMIIYFGILLISLYGAKAKSDAQVLVRTRGEPAPPGAPFAHFPAVEAVPAVPPQEFEFAPTPNGRPLAVEALPDSPALLATPIEIERAPLPEVPQALGEIYETKNHIHFYKLTTYVLV